MAVKRNTDMPNERDDQDPEYGRWQTSTAKTLAEENNAAGLDEPAEICPDWRKAYRQSFVRSSLALNSTKAGL